MARDIFWAGCCDVFCEGVEASIAHVYVVYMLGKPSNWVPWLAGKRGYY